MTDFLFFAVANRSLRWPLLSTVVVVSLLLFMDVSFFVANTPKVLQGGWVPLAIGAIFTVLMLTWKWGQEQVEKASTCSLEAGKQAPSFSAPDCLDLEEPPQPMKVVGVFLLEAPIPMDTL